MWNFNADVGFDFGFGMVDVLFSASERMGLQGRDLD